MRSTHEASPDSRSTVPRDGKPTASASTTRGKACKGQNAQANATVGVLHPDYDSRKAQERKAKKPL